MASGPCSRCAHDLQAVTVVTCISCDVYCICLLVIVLIVAHHYFAFVFALIVNCCGLNFLPLLIFNLQATTCTLRPHHLAPKATKHGLSALSSSQLMENASNSGTTCMGPPLEH